MEKSELKELFAMVASVYPFFDPRDEELQREKLKMWYELLKDQPFSDVKVNLLNWMKSNDKAPLPSNLIVQEDWRKEYELYE